MKKAAELKTEFSKLLELGAVQRCSTFARASRGAIRCG
jgi:hypothetical protein